jgi:Transposase DDE domain
VQLGKTEETSLKPVRLIAYRLPQESANRRRAHVRETCRTHKRPLTEAALELAGWLILVTNAPVALLPSISVGYLYRVRWQIELVFKQFKSVLRLDVLPSKNSSRVQCEIWARLLNALLVFTWYQHANAACLQNHQCEISFAKVAKLLQQDGQVLTRALFSARERLEAEFRTLWKKILLLARKEHQPSRPTTWENLCAHWLDVPVAN